MNIEEIKKNHIDAMRIMSKVIQERITAITYGNSIEAINSELFFIQVTAQQALKHKWVHLDMNGL